MIKALVFDFDGLIIDTETPSYHAFRQVYQQYGVELPVALYAKCVGTSLDHFNPYTYIAECVADTVDLQQFKEKFKAIYAELLKEATIRPGVIAYLEEAKRLNLKVGLASSSHLNWIEPYLIKHHLADYFDSFSTADEVANVKPDPELYLLSLQKLGVAAGEAISFEDSLNGFRAAKAAGLNTVIVPNELTKDFEFADYDLLIPSMAEVDLADLIDVLTGKSQAAK
ncbi:HAD family hydrolase [Paenibacillus sp. FJAT-27812]|uniref:HAD family hydrolase n=1 Tax=Paenibacillus sp. FJAT-27812 TaxID=1684143 RepID=UPI0006A77328|nr:HAD-IA family hydrolase [Paenibacillus sp. FJAT-27812]